VTLPVSEQTGPDDFDEWAECVWVEACLIESPDERRAQGVSDREYAMWRYLNGPIRFEAEKHSEARRVRGQSYDREAARKTETEEAEAAHTGVRHHG